jgi:hypothetical protein
VEQLTVFSDNCSQLVVFNDLPELADGSSLHWDKTMHYYPRSGLLVTLARKSKVVLRRLDLVEHLKKSGIDYLFVHHQPAAGKPGETLRHRLDIRSKSGGVQVKVLSGPEGLKVSADGEVTWAIPADFAEPEAPVRVSVRDASGQEITHEFRISVVEE